MAINFNKSSKTTRKICHSEKIKLVKKMEERSQM